MIDPIVCPKGHHAVELGRDRAWCQTCKRNNEQSAYDRSEIRNLKNE